MADHTDALIEQDKGERAIRIPAELCRLGEVIDVLEKCEQDERVRMIRYLVHLFGTEG